MENIIIIGMPGVGKTSVAKEIAKMMEKSVIDIDETIAEKYGNIPDIFKHHGEAYFRSLETKEIKGACEKTGIVIATGGGSILREENVAMLKKAGRLYWIRRPLKELATGGRPLSAGGLETLEKLWQERKGLYADASDVALENTTIKATAEKIRKEYIAYTSL